MNAHGLCCTVNDIQCICSYSCDGCRCRCPGCSCGPRYRRDLDVTERASLPAEVRLLHDHQPDERGEAFGQVSGHWWARCATCGEPIYREDSPHAVWHTEIGQKR